MLNPKRDTWTIDEDRFPASGSARSRWKFLLQYAVLAPSTRNTQPWKFRIEGDALELHADRSRLVQAFDPRGRELVISCGAALFLLRVALEHFECAAAVTCFPRHGDDDLLARVVFQPGARVPRELRELFSAIRSRHTQRQPFDGRRLPEDLVRRLVADARAEGAEFSAVTSEGTLRDIATLVAEGDRKQAASPSFRLQLASLFRPNLSLRRDGMPGYSHGVGWLRSLLLPWVISQGGWGQDAAEDDFMAVMYAPCLGVLSTAADDPKAWLATGQALGRVLLRASRAGVSASFLGQSVELPELRQRLRQTLGADGQPQLVLRLGYGADAPETPRRSVREVLER